MGDQTTGFSFASALDAQSHRLFLVRSDAPSFQPHLLVINTLTGASTESPALTTGMLALAFDPQIGLVGVTNCCPNNFVRVDTTTGLLTTVSAVGDQSSFFSSASTLDAQSHRLFLVRSDAPSFQPHLLVTNTLTGASTESPALTNGLLALAFELVPPTADLSFSESAAPSPVVSGNQLTYTVMVKNNGPDGATGVTVTDQLPDNIHFNSVASTQGSCTRSTAKPDPKGGTITCSLGNLANGAGATISVVVITTTPLILTNTATEAANETDPNPGNNNANASVVVIGT